MQDLRRAASWKPKKGKHPPVQRSKSEADQTGDQYTLQVSPRKSQNVEVYLLLDLWHCSYPEPCCSLGVGYGCL